MVQEEAQGTGATGTRAAEPQPGDDIPEIPKDEGIGTLIFAAVMLVFGVFWVYASSDLPSRQQTAYLSQGFLPLTAGVLLAVLSALLLISTWRARLRPAEEMGREPLFDITEQLRAAALFAALFVYILILPHVHYLVSTFLLMAVGLAIAREPLRPRLFILAGIMAGLFFAIFVWGLQIALPGSRFG